METILKPSEQSNFLSRVVCPTGDKEGIIDLVYVMGKANTDVLKAIDRTIQNFDPRITRANDFDQKANFDRIGYIESSIPPQTHRLRYHYEGIIGRNAALMIIEKLAKSRLISQEDNEAIHEFSRFSQANIPAKHYMLRRNNRHAEGDSFQR